MLPFIDDLTPKDCLSAAVYRAPVAPARIRRLVVPRPPQGYFAVQARQIPGARVLCCGGYCLPVLAEGRLLYRGEPVVLFCGPDREALGELLRAVVLEWTPEEAGGGRQEGPEPVSLSRGDPQGAFSAAFQIVEGQYGTPASEHCYPGTQGAVAEWSAKGLTIHSSTEDPFAVRREIARLLAVPERKVRVLATRLGDPMQGKLLPAVLVAAQAALLCAASQRPVKLVLDREEDALCTPKSPAFLIRHQTALGADGTPLGARVDIAVSTGPVAPMDSQALREAARAAWGAYRLPNVQVTARWVPAAGAPGGSFRAAGAAAAYFAAELHASRLHEVAQLDPYAWKKRWLPEADRGRWEGKGQSAKTSQQARSQAGGSSCSQAVLDEAVSISDFQRKHAAFAAHKKRRRTLEAGPLRGVGLAVAAAEPEAEPESSGRAPPALRVVLEKGRRLRVYSSLVETAAGLQPILARRAAELLELEADRVEFVASDTSLVADTGPTSLDRALGIALPLLEQCCQAVRRKSLRGSLPVEARRSLSAVRQAGDSRAWAAAVVEVEVDAVSLESECRGLWLAVCAGKILSEGQALRTLGGQAVRAVVLASRVTAHQPAAEAAAPDCGLLPELPDLQHLDIRLLPGEGPPLGYERLPHLCIPAAYTAAVSQATGLYVDEIPVTPEVIQACLQQA